MLLMGTKLDLVKESPSSRQVSTSEAKSLASAKHMVDTIETSSKEDTNISKTFKKLAQELRQKYEGMPAMDDQEQSVQLATTALDETQSNQCKC